MIPVPENAPQEERFDLLEDPTRGLHAVLTRHGIASRSDCLSLVTDLVHWASDACRSSGHVELKAEIVRLRGILWHAGVDGDWR